MTNIVLKVNGASVVASIDGKITSGMVGLPVTIEYDDSWANLTKTALFRVGNQVRKREPIGTSTTVPWEVLRNHGKPLEIGIEGRDGDGNIVMPTVWCSVARVYQGASGEIPAAPNPDNGDSTGGEYATIDDSQTSPNTTWSSQKIADEIASNGGEGGSYELPIATHETLGGVKPVAKTEGMTQSVGVDETGGLWTMPGGGSGGGDNAWKLIGRTTTEEEVTDVIITSETVMSELLVRYSVPPIAEDAGGYTYAMPVIINASGQLDYINANVSIPKPSTKTHRRIWHIMPLGTIHQLWEAGTGSPPSAVSGITDEANLAIRNAYENGGGLVGFRLRWNINGVFPVGTYLEVWGR